MPENAYVNQEITGERDNLSNGIYFTNCDYQRNKKHSVLVVRPDSGTYEYDLPCDQESTSDTLDDDTSKLKKSYINKSKKILLLGIIAIVIILCTLLLAIKHMMSNNRPGKLK